MTAPSTMMSSLIEGQGANPNSWIEVDWNSDQTRARSWIDVEWMPVKSKDDRRIFKDELQRPQAGDVKQNSSKKHLRSTFKNISGFLMGRRTGLVMDPTSIPKDRFGLEDLDKFWACEEHLHTNKENINGSNTLSQSTFKNVKRVCDAIPKLSKFVELSYSMKNQPKQVSEIESTTLLETLSKRKNDDLGIDGAAVVCEELYDQKMRFGASNNTTSNTSDDSSVSNFARNESRSLISSALGRGSNHSDARMAEPACPVTPGTVVERIEDSSVSGDSNAKSDGSFSSLDTLDLRFFDAKIETPVVSGESLSVSTIAPASAKCSNDENSVQNTDSVAVGAFNKMPQVRDECENLPQNHSLRGGEAVDITTFSSSSPRTNIMATPASSNQALYPAPTKEVKMNSSSPSSDMEIVSPSPPRREADSGQIKRSNHVCPVLFSGEASMKISDQEPVPLQDPAAFCLRGIFDDLLRADESTWTQPQEKPAMPAQAATGWSSNTSIDEANLIDQRVVTGTPPESATGKRLFPSPSLSTASIPTNLQPTNTVQNLPTDNDREISVSDLEFSVDSIITTPANYKEKQLASIELQHAVEPSTDVATFAEIANDSPEEWAAESLDREPLQSISSAECLHRIAMLPVAQDVISTSDDQQLEVPEAPVSDYQLCTGTSGAAASADPDLVGSEKPQRVRAARQIKTIANATETWDASTTSFGRGKRLIIKPLQFWRHERVQYIRTPGAPLPEISSIVLRSPESNSGLKLKRAAIRAKGPDSKSVKEGEARDESDRDSEALSDPTNSLGNTAAIPAVELEGRNKSSQDGSLKQRKRCAGGTKKKAILTGRLKLSVGSGRDRTVIEVGSPGSCVRQMAEPRAKGANLKRQPSTSPPAIAGGAVVGSRTEGVGKVAKRKLYAAAMAAFRDDRFDGSDEERA